MCIIMRATTEDIKRMTMVFRPMMDEASPVAMLPKQKKKRKVIRIRMADEDVE